jgi:predicted enzyme related to lactoylglutathione lyase
MNRFTHFELAVNDLEKTAQFYRDVFGWKIQKWEGPVDYWLVTTGDQTTVGINGGLMEADETFKGTINTVEVADIDAIIARVKECGGEIIVEKHPIPSVGWQAYIKDLSGVIMGLHQADEKAGM